MAENLANLAKYIKQEIQKTVWIPNKQSQEIHTKTQHNQTLKN